MLSARIESWLRRTDSLQTALIAVGFWALAVMALLDLRHLYLWGMPQVVGVIARATMACVVLVVGLVGIQRLAARWISGSPVSVLNTMGGMSGVLLLGSVASYLVIGFAVMDEADWRPETSGSLRVAVLCFGVLVAAAVGGRAVLERAGVDRVLQGVLVVLISSCVLVLASPVLRDLGIMAPYRIPFRLTGTFGDPNDAGLVACMTVALATAWLTNGRPRRLGWLGLAVGVAAGLGSASRTALVVLGALAVAFLAINVRSKQRTVVLAVAGTGLAGIAAFVGLVAFSGGVAEWWRLRESGIGLAKNLFYCPAPADNPGADCAVLLAAKDILAGDVDLDWRRSLSVNRWPGVTIGPEGRVTRIDLSGSGLTGRIPPELGRLNKLVSLRLNRNWLTGPVPPELGELTRLEHLVLSFNALSGPVPPELGKLENLKELWLKNNRLTGSVPAALGNLDLSVLRLWGNNFDSTPPELTAVADHHLASTWLCPPVPSTSPALFDDCTVLLAAKSTLAGDATLDWSEHVPIESWQGVTIGGSPQRVTVLELPRAGLNGRVPSALGQLAGLRSLVLDGNALTGPIPPELGKLADLEKLGLADNNLTGPIPSELAKLPSLRELWLGGNRLTGSIPPELEKLTRLEVLSLGDNHLTGPIPPEIANLFNLRQLWLADNRLTGVVPAELAAIEELALAVAGNRFNDRCLPPVFYEGLHIHNANGGLLCTVLRSNDRTALWRLGFHKAMEAPVFGHGLKALKYLDGGPITHRGVLPDPHNLYITLLGEAGVVPLLLFLSAIVLLLRAQWAAPQSLARDATATWILAFALYGMTFSNLLAMEAFMFLAGLSVAAGSARDGGGLAKA